jgi:serine/threonine-protein kinase
MPEGRLDDVSGYAMPKIGDVIADKYRLEKVAGEGGMGIVYAAEHLVLKQRVAVKVLLPDAAVSEAVVERFTREARAAATINSEFVARVLDAGSLPSGAPFLVMEYLEGCDLEELLDLQKTLPVGEVIDYLVQALEGLAHAHAANIVHRDLKPANLFLACRPDGSNAIKLVDFGISKTKRSRPEDKRLTGHHVLGSPVYMSPEQLRNAADIDARADIWSVGIVAYELLAGQPPFDGDGVGEIFAAILEKSPVPLSKLNPKVPPELSEIIAKCLRREPAERWHDAGELARALLPFCATPQGPIVERAEQVLARAKLLTVATPEDTKRVVDAIEAAAERARTYAGSLAPPAHPSPRKVTITGTSTSATTARSSRSPLLVLAIVACFGVVLGALALRRGRAEEHATPTSTAPPSSTTMLVTDAPGSASADTDDEPPVVMELPSSTNGTTPARPRGKTGKPTRPKFLNTRE